MIILDTILDLIFPPKCVVCGDRGQNLCINCLSLIPAAERESAAWITPIYDYRDPGIKKALWLLKYKGRRRLAKIFAEVLYGRIIEELADLTIMENFRESLLIPIPLSNKRYRERGYNQAELICKELIKIDRSAYMRDSVNMQSPTFTLMTNILIKPRETKHQAHIENRTERLKNIVGSFDLKNSELVENKNIILIDDITTTGATLTEAKKILKSAGARKIIAFTVAH